MKIRRVKGLDALVSPNQIKVEAPYTSFRAWFFILGMLPPQELRKPRIHRSKPFSEPLPIKDGEIGRVMPYKKGKNQGFIWSSWR